VKAAAAVLGASLLFFLGVLTGTGRRESVPPPMAIPLGVVDPSASASDGTGSEPPSSDGQESTSTTRTPSTGGPATTATSTPSTTAQTGPPPAPSTTVTTAPPGGVEKVDSEVDCSRGNGKGKGAREPCPTTTTTGRDEGRSGGGNNR